MKVSTRPNMPRFYPLLSVPRFSVTPFLFPWGQMACGQKCFNELGLMILHRAHRAICEGFLRYTGRGGGCDQ